MAGALILGIDPGLSGALALVDIYTGALVDVIDVPVLALKNGREIDEYRLAAQVDQWAPNLTEAWIERVHSMPGEGVSASFTFGRGYGELRGIVCANFVPLHDVGAAIWKRAMGVAGDKDESRKAASALWPSQAHRWPAKKDHGRADACLIAVYGRRKFMAEHGAGSELRGAAHG